MKTMIKSSSFDIPLLIITIYKGEKVESITKDLLSRTQSVSGTEL